MISDVGFFTSQQQHHHSVHRITTNTLRIEISFPLNSTHHHFQFPQSGTSYSHALVVFSTSSSSSSSNNNTAYFSNYLINTLGFSEQQSLSTSTKLIRLRKGRVPKQVTNSSFESNADSVVTFLAQIGLDRSQIQNVVTYHPVILLAHVDNTLKPKIDILHEFGLSGSDIARVTASNPGLLFCPLNRAAQALRAVLGSDEDVAKVLKWSSWNWTGSADKYLIPNVELLESYGVPRDRIRKAVLALPSVFMRPTESFRHILNRVEEKWGVPRGSAAFIYAVQLLSGFSEETIDSKCDLFKSFGWGDSHIQALMRLNPRCLAFSEARIRNSLEFLMNELGYGPAYLTSVSCLLNYCVEKRLVPRHRVLRILKDKGLIATDYKLCSAAVLSESTFLMKFIQPYKETVPDLHEIYVNHLQMIS